MKNKGNLIFWVVILAFLIGVFLFQYNTPKEFIWTPSYSKYDKQPFGSYVFDDVVASSVDNYSLVNKTFYQLYLEYSEDFYYEDEYDEDAYVEDDEDYSDYEYDEEADEFDEDMMLPFPEDERMGILVTEQSVDFTGTDVDALLSLVNRGHKVMLCLGSFPAMLCDSLCFTTTYDSYISLARIEQYAKKGNQRDSLFWGTDSINPERIYSVYPHLHPVYIEEGYRYYSWERDSSRQNDKIICDSLETLVWTKKRQPVVMRLFIGEGELFLVTTPLLFTNYGILDGDNASYAFSLLSYMKDMPIIRLEAYGVNNQPSSTPLRYFLSQSPLRWALYMTMIVIIVFMIFTAKRRQRVIPVVRPPANQTLRFTQLIGNLYYQKKDYKDILLKKYLYFCTEVKRLNGLDLQSDEPEEELCHRLADKMGMDFDKVWPEFRELKHLLRDGRVVAEEEMMRNVDRMNNWMNNLYN
ncbi:MAG: DUF4350 domain-containing protein [Tannerella sp.]|jgi:hypothetical protein|nr:DUF4350 domain-containing protein [Tannerella sp.]